jgi:hypothetical protein
MYYAPGGKNRWKLALIVGGIGSSKPRLEALKNNMSGEWPIPRTKEI